MAIKSRFGFPETPDNENVVFKFKKMSLSSNYAVVSDSNSTTVLENMNCPLDQSERATIKAETVSNIYGTVENLYPNSVKKGVRVVFKLDNLYSTTDDTDPSYRIDEPVSLVLTIKTAKSSRITEEQIIEATERLMSLLYKDDGTSRLPEVLRLATTPKED